MDNFTDISSGSWDDTIVNCEDLTNNGLYVLFVGYVMPLLSPKVREYMKHIYVSIKNAGKVTGDLVSVTEYGFDKIQGLSNNKQMVEFIMSVCESKGFNVLKNEVEELAWSFSGDTDNGRKGGVEQTWKKLLNELDKISAKSKMVKTEKLRP